MKICILLFLLTLFPLHCLAETCPSLTNIKQNTLTEWQAFDSEEGTPLTAKQFAQFRQSIESFALAEWQEIKDKQGIIHCYYKDKTGSALEAYLAKPTSSCTPDNSHNRWYAVSGSLHCAAQQEHCGFMTKLPTFAEKN